MDLLVTDARVVTCDGPEGATGLQRLGLIDRGAVGIAGGRIAYVGSTADAPGEAKETIDAAGRVLLPGLVDPHTHIVFAGSRVDEFARRMAGEDYRKIAAEGGGIPSTVHATRDADEGDLFDGAAARARAFAGHGVTSCEVKSGYGLTTRDETRMLRVARRLDVEGIIRTTTSFLGAHAVPPEMRDSRRAYVDQVVDEQLPAVVREGLADACDVYCDDGAFTLDETRRILEAAQAAGLKVRGHVGQFADLRGAELLGELGGLSADHLEEVSDEGLAAMARAGVVAVLLPGAWRTLRQRPPDVARIRAAGVRMAIGTDCNPGTSPCTDLPLCAALAVRDAGMTLEEAVLGVTAAAARAAGLEDVGRIAPGSRGDLAIYDHEDPRALGYALGGVRAFRTVLGGRTVYRGGSADAAVW
ncbi:MAG: imidazolonepropionase [Polyangiales bacterium]